MNKSLNPEITVGDTIELWHMEDKFGPVLPGTRGEVISINTFPGTTQKVIGVRWENGRTLSILDDVDIYKKVKPKKIEEQTSDKYYNFFKRNHEFFKYFDRKFFIDYLKIMRDSGIINMFEASPLIYCGKEHLDRYYGENNEDNDDFQKLLENPTEYYKNTAFKLNTLIKEQFQYMIKHQPNIS